MVHYLKFEDWMMLIRGVIIKSFFYYIIPFNFEFDGFLRSISCRNYMYSQKKIFSKVREYHCGNEYDMLRIIKYLSHAAFILIKSCIVMSP